MNNKNLILAPLTVMALVSVSGCKHETQRSPTHHSENVVYSNSKFQWVETDYLTFLRGAQRAPFQTGKPVLGTTALGSRLQYWTDQLHAKIKLDFETKNPGHVFAVPKPVLVILPAKDANAWVSGVPICIDVPVRVDTSAGGGTGQARRLMLEGSEFFERKAFFGQSPPTCIKTSYSTDIEGFVSWYNSISLSCRLNYDGKEIVITGAGCREKHGGITGKANGIEYYSTSHYIHMTSSFIAISNDESAVAGTIAHELGHYYRAHTIHSLISNKYEYWYQQKQPPEPGLPRPIADSVQFDEKFKKLSPMPEPRVAGQKLSFKLFDFVIDQVGRNLLPPLKKNACSEAVKMAAEPWASEFTNCFACGHVSDEAEKKYLQYEQHLLACAGKIQIANVPKSNQIGRKAIEETLTSTQLTEIMPKLPEGKTLLEILNRMNNQLQEIDRGLEQIYSQIKERRLGYYTSEQEADDFAIEYTAKVGLDPAHVSLQKYLQYEYKLNLNPKAFLTNNGGLTFEQCLDLRNKKWPEIAPLGNLHDIHHGACFRFFNMDQEIIAHNWTAANEKNEFTHSWAAIQLEAKVITDEFKEIPKGGGGPMGSMSKPAPMPKKKSYKQIKSEGLIIDSY